LVVIDDDPTGTQTVHNIPVLTTWAAEELRKEFSRPEPCFYVLTNSRSLSSADADDLALEVARNLKTAAGDRPFFVVSRSDSTLRGHFPVETDALAEVLGPFDATLLIPYFEDGGRFTINDIHYIAEGDVLVPTEATSFARDEVFGYRSSHLPTYVEEKTRGRIKAREVQSIGLSELRGGGPETVARRLRELPSGCVTVVNAAALSDLDVLVVAVLKAEAQGRRFLFRTAAQFPAARLGLEPRPLRTAVTLGLATLGDHKTFEPSEPADLETASEPRDWKEASVKFARFGGVTIVGSHVPTTTQQLAGLSEIEGLLQIELRVDQLLSSRRHQRISEVAKVVEAAVSTGQDVVVFTSRARVSGETSASNLQIGARVSEALVELLKAVQVRPHYIVAKGGITSSDLATGALAVKRAEVLGQLLPGVPVWRLGPEARFPGLMYVVFPGNVGGPDALATALTILNA
jgi:uncharacterized protein YgbK (DUF1537 family)